MRHSYAFKEATQLNVTNPCTILYTTVMCSKKTQKTMISQCPVDSWHSMQLSAKVHCRKLYKSLHVWQHERLCHEHQAAYQEDEARDSDVLVLYGHRFGS